jgi:hypothetical protein
MPPPKPLSGAPRAFIQLGPLLSLLGRSRREHVEYWRLVSWGFEPWTEANSL